MKSVSWFQPIWTALSVHLNYVGQVTSYEVGPAANWLLYIYIYPVYLSYSIFEGWVPWPNIIPKKHSFVIRCLRGHVSYIGHGSGQRYSQFLSIILNMNLSYHICLWTRKLLLRDTESIVCIRCCWSILYVIFILINISHDEYRHYVQSGSGRQQHSRWFQLSVKLLKSYQYMLSTDNKELWAKRKQTTLDQVGFSSNLRTNW